MPQIRTLIASASLLAIAGLAQAQQTPDATKPNPTAATTTGTSTSQSEMNRGVPGVNVDVGSKASNGVISADVDKKTDARNLTDRSTNTAAGEATRAARSDRN